jgi:hypothetical protein
MLLNLSEIVAHYDPYVGSLLLPSKKSCFQVEKRFSGSEETVLVESMLLLSSERLLIKIMITVESIYQMVYNTMNRNGEHISHN